MQEDTVEKIEYLSFQELPTPCPGNIAQTTIEMGFNSKQWFIQFQTLTNLRQANRHYITVFRNQLLPLNYKQVIAQIDNLRSNNSKEALTLVAEIFEHQDIEAIEYDIIRALINAVILKSVSEKGFLRTQAIKGLNFLAKKWHKGALEELCEQTQSQNGQISELAIKLMSEMIENNKKLEIDVKLLKNLSLNLNGKRAVLQKIAKQILLKLKQREGEQKLQEKIISSSELLEEESTTLRRQLKEKEQKSKGPSLKQFIRQKKLES